MVLLKSRVFTTLLLIGAILVIAITESPGQEQRKPSNDEAAIRQVVQSYAEAFNKGDAAAVAAHWNDDAEYVTPTQERLKGRKKIEAFLKKFFEENKDLKIDTSVATIRFPSPGRAVETGKITVTRPGGTPEESLYIAEYAKRRGAWKLTRVREEECSPNYEHLKDLEWLIGEWIDKDDKNVVESAYTWNRNKSFITGSFVVLIEGKADLEGAQIIGWDPVKKTIRSWVFDSKGGFGQATWFRNGNQWIAESSTTMSNGEKASAINIYTFVDDDTFTFQSTGRQIGEELIPNIDEVVVVRKPPVRPAARTGRETR